MGLETGSFIADLIATNPLASDAVGQGDDHIRLIKACLLGSLPNLGGRLNRVQAANAGYTVLSTDNTILIEIPTAAGATVSHTFSLPALSSITAGFYFDITTQGQGDFATLVPTGGATIEGSATLLLGPQVHARVYYNGTNWRVHAAVPVQGATGNARVSGGLTVSGSTVLGGTLGVGGAATIGGALTLLTGVTNAGTTSLSGAVVMHTTLSVSGAAHFKTTLSVGGAVAMASTLSVSGAAHMNTTLSVGGVATFASTVTISGTCVLTSGQLVFPAIQNASAGSNTLDDYEEGTWTPAVTFATAGNLVVVYTTQGGDYTKIGRMVTLTLNIVTSTFTHTTASGEVRVSGVPFGCNVANDGLWMGEGITKANYTQFSMHLDGGADVIMAGRAMGSGQLYTSVNAADMPTGTTKIIFVTHTYHAS